MTSTTGASAGASAAGTHAGTALIVLDMINTFDFPRGSALCRAAGDIAPRLASLKTRVKRAGGRCIYVNDNVSDWRAEFSDLVRLAAHGRGADVVRRLAPERDDWVLFKSRHSAFHQTPLASVLREGGLERVLVTGVSAEACVLTTAMDARMLQIEVTVVSDCIAASSAARVRDALAVLRHCDIPCVAARRALRIA